MRNTPCRARDASLPSYRRGRGSRALLVAFAVGLNVAPASRILAADPAPPALTIEFSVEVSRSAPNDLARATAFAEATDPDPGQLAKRVNAAIADGLRIARAKTAVKTRSGTTLTHPNYAKGGTRIESWRMRAELLLESRDATALSELIGQLQSVLNVTQITLAPSPETRRKVEDEAALAAIDAFRTRAGLIAESFGQPYRIKRLSISGSGRPPTPVLRAAMAAEAMPPPLEPGESELTVLVAGQIELDQR
jgi:predicted secreted protein